MIIFLLLIIMNDFMLRVLQMLFVSFISLDSAALALTKALLIYQQTMLFSFFAACFVNFCWLWLCRIYVCSLRRLFSSNSEGQKQDNWFFTLQYQRLPTLPYLLSLSQSLFFSVHRELHRAGPGRSGRSPAGLVPTAPRQRQAEQHRESCSQFCIKWGSNVHLHHRKQTHIHTQYHKCCTFTFIYCVFSSTFKHGPMIIGTNNAAATAALNFHKDQQIQSYYVLKCVLSWWQNNTSNILSSRKAVLLNREMVTICTYFNLKCTFNGRKITRSTIRLISSPTSYASFVCNIFIISFWFIWKKKNPLCFFH